MKDQDKIKFGKIKDEFMMIPFNKIHRISQYTDDKDYDKGNIETLKEKIKSYGFDKAFPLTVDRSTKEGFFNVVSGNHRFVAMDELVKEGTYPNSYEVPVILKGFENYQERLIYQVGENQRRIPLATDEGKAYRQLFDSGMNIEEIAKRFGQRKPTIETRLYLTFLSPDLFKLVGKDIPISIASAIGKSSLNQNNKPDYDLQLDLYKWYIANKGTYGEPHHIESRARELGSMGFDFFSDNSTLTDAQKKGLADVGSEEEAKRIIDKFKKTFEQIQKSYQKLFGENVAELNPDLIKKLSGAFAYTNDNYLDKLEVILSDLKQVKIQIENKIRNLKGQSEIPIVFAPNLNQKIDKLETELNTIKLPIEKPKVETKKKNLVLEQETKPVTKQNQTALFGNKPEAKFLRKDFKPVYKYNLDRFNLSKLIESIKDLLLENGMDDSAKAFIELAYKHDNLIKLEPIWKKFISMDTKEYNKILNSKHEETINRGLFV